MKIVNNFKLVVKGSCIFLIYLSTFLPLNHSTSLFAADDNYPTILQEKMKIEKEYEKRISEIIEKIAGPDKAVVSVTVELRLAKQSVSASKSEGKSENTSPFSGSRPKSKILPGFEEEIPLSGQQQGGGGEGKASGTTQKIEQTVIPTVINAIKVTILLAQGVPEDKELVIKEAITQSIGGDVGNKSKFELIVKKAAFSSQASNFWTPFLKPSALIPLVLGLIFLIIIIGPLQNVLQSFAAAIREGRKGGGEFTVLQKTESKGETSGSGGGGGGGGGIGVGAGGEAGTVTLKEGENEKRKNREKPFEYINKDNLKNLLYLIQEETPEAIAVIVTYLEPELSASIIDSISSDVQMQVALCLVNVRLTSEEDVSKIHDSIKKKIDFLVGGIDAFIKIIEQVDNRVRKEMLDALEKQSPRLAKRVKESIFMFEDLANLPDLTVQFILREVKMDQLAVALKGPNADIVMQKVMTNMSEGGRLLLKEEMDFGRPVTQQQIEEIQREIEKTVQKMEKERKIVIKKEETADGRKGIEIEGRLQKLDIGDEYKSQQTQQQTGQPQTQRPGESPQRAIEYYNAGITAYSSSKLDDAIHFFQRSVEYNQNFWQAWQYLGSCLYSKGRIEEALKAYEKSLSINSSNTQLRDWLNSEKQKRISSK